MADGSALAAPPNERTQAVTRSAVKDNGKEGVFKDMGAIYRKTGVKVAVIRKKQERTADRNGLYMSFRT
jgi:hypothetical protein